VVRHGERALTAVKNQLDRLAGTDRGAFADLAAWRVDPVGDTVVVSLRKGRGPAAARKALARFGDAVHVQRSDLEPALNAAYMLGGYRIGNSQGYCSAGFNVRNGLQYYLLTAGHCAAYGNNGPVSGFDGTYFGPFVAYNYPGTDYAIAANNSAGYWVQGPWVAAWLSDPYQVYPVNGAGASGIGSVVCKSGAYTYVTCGYVEGLNETVAFETPTGGVVVDYGLTRASYCSDYGDSGAATFSAGGSGIFAEGIHIGAAANVRCTAWYVPIAGPLSAYGALYGISLWTV
jgi:hypothetical protein